MKEKSCKLIKNGVLTYPITTKLLNDVNTTIVGKK